MKHIITFVIGLVAGIVSAAVGLVWWDEWDRDHRWGRIR